VADFAIRLKPGKQRPVLAGHPWIFSGAIADLDGSIEPGSIVSVHDAAGTFVARGYVNPRCTIAARVLTSEDEPIDSAFISRRVTAASNLRRAVLPEQTNAFRLINGEGDFLPGIVADVYGSVVVLQCLTAGAARLRSMIVDALIDVLDPACIFERSVGNVRREEGLSQEVGALLGEPPIGPVDIVEQGLRFLVDIESGQKTGFFLDQRDNRQLVRALSAGRRVLNAFAYTGAFGVYAGAGGATSVVSIESSARALDVARRNWEANGLAGTNHEFVEADIFELLRQRSETYDLLVLDPPALVKRRHEVQRGARAYKDLHLWAFRRAAPGALIVTFSCSQHVPADLFWKIVHGAAVDAGRAVQALRPLAAGADHPISLAHPEGGYLKGLLLRVT
jgi:23S rRNA (cytosine1962-C5)-methyltransferase